MAKKEPVNLIVQVIVTILPFGCLYSFYRVQKLKWVFLIFIPLIAVTSTVDAYFLYQEGGSIFAEEGYRSSQFDIIAKTFFLLTVVIFVYLIIRWSKEWNHNLSLSGAGYKSFR